MKLFRYTSNGEGVFSIGRRLLDLQPQGFIDQVMEVVKDSKQWLLKPKVEEENLEFYWTDTGRKKYENTFLPLHQKYIPNIVLEEFDYNKLPGRVVYQDEYQVAIVSDIDKTNLPNPYK